VSFRGKLWGAHRVAFTFHHGREPQKYVLHSCDNPGCCNPAHLREGTQLENMRDMNERGRRIIRTGEESPLYKGGREAAQQRHIQKQIDEAEARIVRGEFKSPLLQQMMARHNPIGFPSDTASNDAFAASRKQKADTKSLRKSR